MHILSSIPTSNRIVFIWDFIIILESSLWKRDFGLLSLILHLLQHLLECLPSTVVSFYMHNEKQTFKYEFTVSHYYFFFLNSPVPSSITILLKGIKLLTGACPSCDKPLPVLVDYTSTFLAFFIVFIRKRSLFVCWQQEAYSGTLPRKAEKDLPDWLWTPKPLNSSWQLLHSHDAHFSSNPCLFFLPRLSVCFSIPPSSSQWYSKHRQ